jgi:hypothetical protein
VWDNAPKVSCVHSRVGRSTASGESGALKLSFEALWFEMQRMQSMRAQMARSRAIEIAFEEYKAIVAVAVKDQENDIKSLREQIASATVKNLSHNTIFAATLL